MAKLKLFVFYIEDYVPFLCFSAGFSEANALFAAKKRFSEVFNDPTIKITPIENLLVDQTLLFMIDPELFVIKSPEELKFWTNPDDFDESLLDNELPERDDKNVKLLPDKAGENAEDSCETNCGNLSEELDKKVWI
jgi:hypothetical protein